MSEEDMDSSDLMAVVGSCIKKNLSIYNFISRVEGVCDEKLLR